MPIFWAISLIIIVLSIVFWPLSRPPQGLTHVKEVPYREFQGMLYDSQIEKNVVILNRVVAIAQEEDIIFEIKGREGKFWAVVPGGMRSYTAEYYGMSYFGLNLAVETKFYWDYLLYLLIGIIVHIFSTFCLLNSRISCIKKR